jgi:DNA-binding SARP family transcriptional activator
VQVYVSQLRAALGAVTIATQPPGYALGLDLGSIDFGQFARLTDEGRAALAAGDPAAADAVLRTALGLWRGPALADFLYEPFAQTEIARLEELRLVALEARIDAELALGRHLDLIGELETLVETQPLRERPLRQLMLALYRSGRQVDALAAYRRVRAKLVEELGIEPGPEVKELEAAILRQDESLLPERASMRAMEFRRLVTVVIATLRRSLTLAEPLDAEAAAEVLRQWTPDPGITSGSTS